MLLCYSPSTAIIHTGVNTVDKKGSTSKSNFTDTIILNLYKGQESRRQLRKIKLKMTWLTIKQKIKEFFVTVANA